MLFSVNRSCVALRLAPFHKLLDLHRRDIGNGLPCEVLVQPDGASELGNTLFVVPRDRIRVMLPVMVNQNPAQIFIAQLTDLLRQGIHTLFKRGVSRLQQLAISLLGVIRVGQNKLLLLARAITHIERKIEETRPDALPLGIFGVPVADPAFTLFQAPVYSIKSFLAGWFESRYRCRDCFFCWVAAYNSSVRS